MKCQELIETVPVLSMQQIDELVDSGIEIEDIQYILLNEDKICTEILFENNKLRELLFKQMNAYMYILFETAKNNKKFKFVHSLANICETYLKSYFKDAIKVQIGTEKAKDLFETIMQLEKEWPFISEASIEANIFGEYRQALNEKIEYIEKMSKEQIEEYDFVLKSFMEKQGPRYITEEVKSALKIAQINGIDISQIQSLNYFIKKIENKEPYLSNDYFSLLLQYEILLKNKGIKYEREYSPINDMEDKLKNGSFAEFNELSYEEFSFVLKVIQNPHILSDENMLRLNQILQSSNLTLEIGSMQISELLENKELFLKIGGIYPNMQKIILQKIEKYVYNQLSQLIEFKSTKVSEQYLNDYKKYLKNYFEISLNEYGDTQEMCDLVCLMYQLSYPNSLYNVIRLENQSDIVEILKEEFEKNNVVSLYIQQMFKLCNKIKGNPNLTKNQLMQYDKILNQFSYIYHFETEEEFDMLEAIKEKSEELQVRSKTIETQIEKYIDLSIKGVELEEKIFNIIINYYGTQLKGTELEINQNSAIAHLIRAAQKKKIPQKMGDIVLEKLEKRKNNNLITKPNNLDGYMQNVAEIRLHEGRMPQECCYFIIKQVILNDKDIENYSGMIERAIEDFTEYELQDLKIDDYYVAMLDNQFLNSEDNLGIMNGTQKVINLSRQYFELFKMTGLLDTIAHECAHAQQENRIVNGDFNGDIYKMKKEKIIMDYKNNYYKFNYMYMYNEIDARKNGYIKRIKILKKIGLTDEQIKQLNVGDIKSVVNEYLKDYKQGKLKNLEGEVKDVNTIFLEILQENPEILEDNPIFNIEYEKDGDNIQRKNIVKILTCFEEMLNQAESQKEIEKISNLCTEILLNSSYIQEENMQKEIEQLIAFSSDNPIITAYKNKILTTKFPQAIVMRLTMKSMYEEYSKQPKAELQKRLITYTQGEIESNRENEDGRN